MLRFYFPKDTSALEGGFAPEALRHSLFMLAEDEGQNVAAARFMYKGSQAVVEEIRQMAGDVSLAVLDGLFRSMMFHLMEMGCTAVTVEKAPEAMADYFKALGFEQAGEAWSHPDFEQALFSGCPGGGH
jgi:hypothetical protein